MASRSTNSRSTRAAATTCCSSAASIPTRAPAKRSARRGAAGRRLSCAAWSRTRTITSARSRPFVDGDRVDFRGVIGGGRAARALGAARGLLHLIGFDEPFGLSVIEAMACGTPVIAYNRGSMPELIDHGVTGFLVDTFDEAVAAIGRLGEIDRRACRAAVEQRFTVERMADQYLALYRRTLADSALS